MRRALILMTFLLTAACAKTERVVEGTVALDATPKEVVFLTPVTARGPRRELCFEFDRPGASHRAAEIRAVLVTDKGAREELHPVEVDRRGEALVCLLHRTGTTKEGQVRYQAVILSSPTPMRLRQIRWWSG
jgi:hypothetical protein